MKKVLLLWQVGLIANIKLHFCTFPTVAYKKVEGMCFRDYSTNVRSTDLVWGFWSVDPILPQLVY